MLHLIFNFQLFLLLPQSHSECTASNTSQKPIQKPSCSVSARYPGPVPNYGKGTKKNKATAPLHMCAVCSKLCFNVQLKMAFIFSHLHIRKVEKLIFHKASFSENFSPPKTLELPGTTSWSYRWVWYLVEKVFCFHPSSSSHTLDPSKRGKPLSREFIPIRNTKIVPYAAKPSTRRYTLCVCSFGVLFTFRVLRQIPFRPPITYDGDNNRATKNLKRTPCGNHRESLGWMNLVTRWKCWSNGGKAPKSTEGVSW